MPLIESTAYAHTDGNASYHGLVLESGEFSNYISTRVNRRYYDAEGMSNLSGVFDDVAQAGFDPERLKSLFSSTQDPTYWKIGEKLAECFLEDSKGAIFPYNGNRDAKDSRASMQGADLVGLVTVSGRLVFLFGEVKSSEEKSSPPRIIYGRNGLVEQLNEIKSTERKRKELIQWLGHKVSLLGEDDGDRMAWQKATVAYMESSGTAFKIFGVMVRETDPDERDLKVAFKKIVIDLNSQTHLELLALYIPIRISGMEGAMGASN